MSLEGKRKTVDTAIKVLIAAMLLLWVVLIYNFATSTLPMIRQLLGCMLTTMVIFSLLSFAVSRLKSYKESLVETEG